MNVLSGLLRPDEGTIEILGDDSPVRSPRAAIDRGIGVSCSRPGRSVAFVAKP